jgi:hypothetical protein
MRLALAALKGVIFRFVLYKVVNITSILYSIERSIEKESVKLPCQRRTVEVPCQRWLASYPQLVLRLMKLRIMPIQDEIHCRMIRLMNFVILSYNNARPKGTNCSGCSSKFLLFRPRSAN